LLKAAGAGNIAMIAGGSMTNEEMFMTRRLRDALKIELHDIVPRSWEGDHILVSSDKNANTNGAKVLGLCDQDPGSKIKKIAEGVKNGSIKSLLVLGEDLTVLDEFSAADLAKLDSLVYVGILANETTAAADVVLPGSGFAEKRGSMINVDGRLQRLMPAVRPPSQSMDTWEILRDLNTAVGGGNGIYLIEELFKSMSEEVREFRGLSLSKIGDTGVQLLDIPREEKKIGKTDENRHQPAGADAEDKLPATTPA
jgi:NADH-quinone oxidoreductase subunit G